jgi:predicted ester cyclase
MGGSADANDAVAAHTGDVRVVSGVLPPPVAKGRVVRRRSPVLLVVCLLALATGVTFLGLGESLSGVPLARGRTHGGGEAQAALVRDFYDGVNATLRSGQPADLDRFLSADFVEHGGPPGLAPDRTGLVRHLLALHATFPTMQLSAQDVLAEGDVVAARVRVDGVAPGAFLGLHLSAQPAAWSDVDLFRIAGGRIAEHWGDQEDAPFFEPLQEAPLDLHFADWLAISLVRTIAAPGSSQPLRAALGPQLLYVETGRLTVAISADAADQSTRWRAPSPSATEGPDAVVPGGETTMAEGELLLLPVGSKATATNQADTSTTFLTIALRAPGASSGSEALATPAVATVDLAGRMPATLPTGPARVGLGRVTLAAGASLRVHAPGAALLAVEAGTLSQTITDGTTWSRHGADGAITTAGDGTLRAGDATLMELGASAELRSAGDAPLVLLVVTITPDA